MAHGENTFVPPLPDVEGPLAVAKPPPPPSEDPPVEGVSGAPRRLTLEQYQAGDVRRSRLPAATFTRKCHAELVVLTDSLLNGYWLIAS